MLVEDADENRKLIKHLLERAGGTVQGVEHGQAGVEAALSSWADGQPFDLILMDMRMPVKDGYEATRDLRAAGYQAPIIALTAHAMSHERARCLDVGCDDFITKPLPKDLADRLGNYPRPEAVRPNALHSTEAADPDLEEMITSLVERMSSEIEQLQAVLESGDQHELEDRVHKLKGVVGLYGFHHVTPFTQRVLEAIRGQCPSDEVEAACHRLFDVLGRLVSGTPATIVPSPLGKES